MAELDIRNYLSHLEHRYGISLTTDDVSDGYHTFGCLYHQRCILFAALVRAYPDISWKTRYHDDGEPCFGGGWFLVGINTPKGPFTYHFEDKDWHLFDCPELERAPEWDGHTADDVERLLHLEDEPLPDERQERLF